MTFLAQIFAWIISDVRHIIIIVLSVLLIGTGVYCLTLKWQVADKDQKLSEFKVDNERLKLNNTNLTAQLEQCTKANAALNSYIKSIFVIKKETDKIKEQVSQIRSKEDEIKANNALVVLFNTHGGL